MVEAEDFFDKDYLSETNISSNYIEYGDRSEAEERFPFPN